MSAVTRRSVMAGAAAAVAAVPAVGLSSEGPSEFAALVRRYFKEVDVFNSTNHETDEASDAHADSTYNATMHQMAKTPVRTADDAQAVLDFMWDEDLIEEWAGDFDGFSGALINSLRDYIAGRVA